MAALSLLLGLVVILLITALTAYFVAQEFAYMAVDRSTLGAAATEGDGTAARTLKVTQRTSFMLSGAQLGITVTGLLVGYVAEPLVGRGLGEMLGGVGVPTAVGVAVGTVLALTISTVVQMVFGELFPKNLAIARPEPVARWLSRSTLAYLKVFGWLIWFFDQASNLLLRSLKIEPVHDVEHAASAADLEHIVAHSRDTGDLAPGLSLLLDRILDFPEESVEHAMVPRVRVDTVAPETTLAELRTEMSTGGHSRYPILDDEDHIVGLVDLVDVLAARDEKLTAADLAHPALLVPTLMRLPEAVGELARAKQQMACVIDEYGGFDGVITIEDLAEELIGEISDEHDDDSPEPYVEATEGGWLISGVTPVDEVERAIDRDLPEGDYETVAGLVIDAHGRFPDVGTVIRVDLGEDLGLLPGEPDWREVEIEVVELDRHIPGLVRLRLVSAEESAAHVPHAGPEPEPEAHMTGGSESYHAEHARTEREGDA